MDKCMIEFRCPLGHERKKNWRRKLAGNTNLRESLYSTREIDV